jgi:hypothetical protein
MLIEGLKRLVPRGAKEAAKDSFRAWRLSQAVREVHALGPRAHPRVSTLLRLRAGWGNESYSAGVGYIEEVFRHLDSGTGPILECGSGLTTVLLGILAAKRGRELYTLEHDPDWHARVSRTLAKHGVEGVHLSLAPLVDYDGIEWYAPVESLPARFDLVICDGPPETTPGGRYGLLAAAGHRMTAATVILLDDASRTSEIGVLDRWRREAGWRFEILGTPPSQYAVVRCA